MDVHEPEVRSYNMSRIKSKDTKPEIFVRKFLFANGFRYRLHAKNLPGKPDVILPKYKTAIFINGCFWHGHENCHYFKLPKTRTEWWRKKIQRNRDNDIIKHNKLKDMDYRLIIIWECQIKNKSIYTNLINDIKTK